MRFAFHRRKPSSIASPVANDGASHCADCCSKSPTCCCSTSPRTIWMPKASPGSSAFFKEYAGTVVAVTHDRYFLDNVAGWILELDRGSGFPYEGNYTGWLEQKREASRRSSKNKIARAEGR